MVGVVALGMQEFLCNPRTEDPRGKIVGTHDGPVWGARVLARTWRG